MPPQPEGNDALLGPDQGDMGLGLCLACVAEWKTENALGKGRPVRTPNYAIALSPTMVPVPGTNMMFPVSVGQCLEHIEAGPAPVLVVANGRG